jgi:hypothetical protein
VVNSSSTLATIGELPELLEYLEDLSEDDMPADAIF